MKMLLAVVMSFLVVGSVFAEECKLNAVCKDDGACDKLGGVMTKAAVDIDGTKVDAKCVEKDKLKPTVTDAHIDCKKDFNGNRNGQDAAIEDASTTGKNGNAGHK
jgi:hypothetical protein